MSQMICFFFILISSGNSSMHSKSIYIHAQNIGDESKTQDEMD